MNLAKIDFESALFWFQIHGLNEEYLSEENGRMIGAIIGKTVQVDCDDNKF